MVEVPRLESPAPLAVVCTTFRTQVVSAWNGAGLGIGNGGPKKQFASSAQEPAAPPQFPSLVHEGSELLLTQCRPGPDPRVQFLGLVPALAPSVDAPVICRNDAAASGILPPATTL